MAAPANTSEVGRGREVGAVARVCSGDLRGLDRLGIDALVLLLFEARAQPLGVAGLADWRLAGRIGRLLASGRFRGAPGEALLLSSPGRLGAERIFVLGLGPLASWDLAGRDPKALGGRLGPLVEVVRAAGAERIALAPPDAPRGGPEAAHFPEEIASAWLEVPGRPFREVLLLDLDGRLASARERLETAARRGGYTLGP